MSIKDDFRKFADADGRMSLMVISAKEFPAMVTAAMDGDQLARRAMDAIGQWFQRANASEDAGNKPGCVLCHADLHPESFGGVGLLLPESEAAVKAIGLVMALCCPCAERPPDDIRVELFEAISRDFHVEVSMMQ